MQAVSAPGVHGGSGGARGWFAARHAEAPDRGAEVDECKEKTYPNRRGLSKSGMVFTLRARTTPAVRHRKQV